MRHNPFDSRVSSQRACLSSKFALPGPLEDEDVKSSVPGASIHEQYFDILHPKNSVTNLMPSSTSCTTSRLVSKPTG